MKKHPVKCLAEYCLYNENKACNLFEPPKINGLGMCDACIYVNITDKMLNAERKRTREERKAVYELWNKLMSDF